MFWLVTLTVEYFKWFSEILKKLFTSEPPPQILLIIEESNLVFNNKTKCIKPFTAQIIPTLKIDFGEGLECKDFYLQIMI